MPVCFIENGKEIKRFKNIEIPDEIKELPYQDFEFSVPIAGAITFKIMFEEGVLPKVWPEAQQEGAEGAGQPEERDLGFLPTKRAESKKLYNRKKSAHAWKNDFGVSALACAD